MGDRQKLKNMFTKSGSLKPRLAVAVHAAVTRSRPTLPAAGLVERLDAVGQHLEERLRDRNGARP